MNKVLVSLLLTLGITGMAHAAGNAEAGQGKVAVCGACHGVDGNSVVPMYPSLAGQSANYIAKQLADFKSGLRNDPVMAGMVAGLPEEDILGKKWVNHFVPIEGIHTKVAKCA